MFLRFLLRNAEYVTVPDKDKKLFSQFEITKAPGAI